MTRPPLSASHTVVRTRRLASRMAAAGLVAAMFGLLSVVLAARCGDFAHLGGVALIGAGSTLLLASALVDRDLDPQHYTPRWRR